MVAMETPDVQQKQYQAMLEVNAYFTALIADRRVDPRG